jgi:hypothetical protein
MSIDIVLIFIILSLVGLLLAKHIRLRREIDLIRGVCDKQKARLEYLEIDIQAIKEEMVAKDAQTNEMKRQMAKIQRTVSLTQNIGHAAKDEAQPSSMAQSITTEALSAATVPSADIGQQWIELINASRPVYPETLPWRICGVDIANLDERLLLQVTSAKWDILGETPEAIRRARFWLVGPPASDYSILAPSLFWISERALWMQGGEDKINALLQGHYRWDKSATFAALEVARIDFDKASNTFTIKSPGHLVLDLY